MPSGHSVVQDFSVAKLTISAWVRAGLDVQDGQSRQIIRCCSATAPTGHISRHFPQFIQFCGLILAIAPLIISKAEPPEGTIFTSSCCITIFLSLVISGLVISGSWTSA